MTALWPTEQKQNVRGVASKRYPASTVCSHPECDKPANSQHHIFGRQPPESDSWFVEVEVPKQDDGDVPHIGYYNPRDKITIPHVIGLCGSGTTGHHGDLEEHRAWVKLEDGEFTWWERLHKTAFLHPIDDPNREFEVNTPGLQVEKGSGIEGCPPERQCNEWRSLGPLDPQPGDRAKAKKPRKRHEGEAPRKRETISIRVPKDERENGAKVWAELMEQVSVKLGRELGLDGPDERPPYFQLVDALSDWITN